MSHVIQPNIEETYPKRDRWALGARLPLFSLFAARYTFRLCHRLSVRPNSPISTSVDSPTASRALSKTKNLGAHSPRFRAANFARTDFTPSPLVPLVPPASRGSQHDTGPQHDMGQCGQHPARSPNSLRYRPEGQPQLHHTTSRSKSISPSDSPQPIEA